MTLKPGKWELISAQKWSKSWILSAALSAACTFVALASAVEDDVGREAEVTCFKIDFGTPGNIDGGSLGRFPPFTDTHSQLKCVSQIYISFKHRKLSFSFGIANIHLSLSSGSFGKDITFT